MWLRCKALEFTAFFELGAPFSDCESNYFEKAQFGEIVKAMERFLGYVVRP